MGGLQNITVAPESAELFGRLQAQTNRAILAESKLGKVNEELQASIRWCAALVTALVDARQPVPPKRGGAREPFGITSSAGRLVLTVPDGVFVIERGAAADEVILRLVDHARAAFPEDFPEVF